MLFSAWCKPVRLAGGRSDSGTAKLHCATGPMQAWAILVPGDARWGIDVCNLLVSCGSRCSLGAKCFKRRPVALVGC